MSARASERVSELGGLRVRLDFDTGNFAVTLCNNRVCHYNLVIIVLWLVWLVGRINIL